MKAQSSYIANGYASGAAFSEMAIAVRTNASKQGQSRSLTPTGSPHASGGFARTAGIALIFVVGVGTGGTVSPEYFASRKILAGQFHGFDRHAVKSPQRLTLAPSRSAKRNLERFREVFKPTVTDLAALLGVSRQAIYNWQGGQPVTEQNDVRLEQLARAADMLKQEGIPASSRMLRRKIAGGSTFFDSVRVGKPADVVATALISIIKRDLVQRDLIDARLSGRPSRVTQPQDIGLPHFDERA